MTHLLNLVAQRHNTLEDENLQMREELAAAKRALFRMDKRREGLIRFIDHLRASWVPQDPSDEHARGIKEDPKKFNAALVEAIASVNRDSAYCTSRDATIEEAIAKEAGEAIKREKDLQQKLIADKWARKERT